MSADGCARIHHADRGCRGDEYPPDAPAQTGRVDHGYGTASRGRAPPPCSLATTPLSLIIRIIHNLCELRQHSELRRQHSGQLLVSSSREGATLQWSSIPLQRHIKASSLRPCAVSSTAHTRRPPSYATVCPRPSVAPFVCSREKLARALDDGADHERHVDMLSR